MKIDTSSISGYAEMSAEDKVAALEAFDYTDYKDAFDKASHEAADFKKQLKAEQEKSGKGSSDYETLKADFEAYKANAEKEKNIATYTAEFLAQGYAKELAEDTAKAMADGDAAKVFANQKSFMEQFKKDYKAEIMKDTPHPDKGGKPPEGMTKEKLKKLSFAERAKFANEHPDEYNKLYNGG